MVVPRTTAVIVFGSPTKFLVVRGLPDYRTTTIWTTDCNCENILVYKNRQRCVPGISDDIELFEYPIVVDVCVKQI